MRPATSRRCGWSAWWAKTGPPSTPSCSQPRNIDTAGLQVVPGGKTFRWRGKYLPNMNDRETLEVQLNVFEQFDPVLPEDYRRCQVPVPGQRLAGAAAEGAGPVPAGPSWPWPTRWTWIRNERDDLMKLLKRIDGLVLNDSEAKLLTGDENLVRAGHDGARNGPEVRRHQEGRARGDVLQQARDLRAARLSDARTWSTRPAPATASPAA